MFWKINAFNPILSEVYFRLWNEVRRLSAGANFYLGIGTAMKKSEAFLHIQTEIKNNRIVLFMKGTPAHPKCSFSADASNRLKEAGIAYKNVDVSSDPALYDELRQYTNYPRFPQMFVDGRFIGGTDDINKFTAAKKL